MTATLPKVTLNILPSGAERVQDQPQKVLFVGQMIKNFTPTGSAAGTFTPAAGGSLVTDIQNDGLTDGLFGKKSMMATMLRAARKENQLTRFDAVVLEDPTEVFQHIIPVQFGGVVTADGILEIAIGSRTNHTFKLNLTVGNGVGEIDAGLTTAIGNDKEVPVVVLDAVGGLVPLILANRGLEATKITVQIVSLPQGITAEVQPVQLVGVPAVNPDLSAVFDLIGNERYQTIVWPETYDQDLFTDEAYKALRLDLEAKFNFFNKILDGVAIITATDNVTNLIAFATPQDTQVLTVFGNPLKTDDDLRGGAIVEIDYVQSSYVAAIRSLRLTKDADIVRFVSATNGALDNFGGAHMASFPYFNTPYSLLPIIPQGRGFSLEEIAELSAEGVQISLLSNNDANTGLVALQVQTLSSTAGTPDPNDSFRFLNSVDTISGVREYFFNNLKARYRQTRLTLGDLVPGVNIANANSIKAFMGSLYKDLSGPDFVLVASGATAIKFFKDNLTVEIDLLLGKATINAKVILVTQLREIIGDIQIVFSTNN